MKIKSILRLKFTLPFLFILSLTGCATTGFHEEAKSDPGTRGSGSSKSDLTLTWDLNEDFSSEYFAYFNFNIANHSDKWHTLTGIRIVFPKEAQNKDVKVLLGKDLLQWYDSQMKVIDVAEYNKEGAALLLAGVGMVASAVSSNKDVKAAGSALALGAFGYLAVDEFDQARKNLTEAEMIPKNHLLADTIRVPPGLFTDRWVVLNSTDHAHMGIVDTLRIEYQLEDGKVESKKLVLRKDDGLPSMIKWQAAAFKKKQAGEKKRNSELGTVTYHLGHD